MLVKFYVNGMCVDTYKCSGHIEYGAAGGEQIVGLTEQDEVEIEACKITAYRNFGYPAVLQFIEEI